MQRKASELLGKPIAIYHVFTYLHIGWMPDISTGLQGPNSGSGKFSVTLLGPFGKFSDPSALLHAKESSRNDQFAKYCSYGSRLQMRYKRVISEAFLTRPEQYPKWDRLCCYIIKRPLKPTMHRVAVGSASPRLSHGGHDHSKTSIHCSDGWPQASLHSITYVVSQCYEGQFFVVPFCGLGVHGSSALLQILSGILVERLKNISVSSKRTDIVNST